MTGQVHPGVFNRMLAERCLTVSELAQISGVSRVTLARVRQGKSVDMKTLRIIAATLENIQVRPLMNELLVSA